MRIGINLLYLLPGIVGGTETYASGLLHGLAQIDHEDEFVIFVNRESAKWPIPQAPNISRIICPISASSRFSRYYYEQLKFPQLLVEHRIDIIHSLGYVGPLLSRCASVVTIPDLNFMSQKHAMSWKKRFFLRLFSTQSARRADHVITISFFSRNEILKAIKLPSDKITVTHLGPIKKNAKHLSNGLSDTCKNFGITRPYIAAFGGGTPNKNISSLIHAFSLLSDVFPHTLVLIGHIPSNVDLSVESLGNDLKARIITTGYIQEDHIIPLLGNAELFVLPSLYEGFGLPLLEAQQSNVAIASSNAGSLPEVGGEGAIYFDPISIEDMSKTMRTCLSDPDLRSSLILKGQKNLERFSWSKTASDSLAIYYNAVRRRTKG
jgi:glycosyltransferase involved in cell wall biosynthesis